MTDFNSTQPSFSAGIISTELFSRIDYSKLLSGLKQCENWIVRPAGGAEYRTGSKFISQTKTGTGEVFLMPFNQSRDNSYCLEFGAGYIRFYKDGEQITSGGSPVEVSTTYTSSEIGEIKYAQEKNQMFIVHKNHCPAVLTRNSDTSWTLTDLVFNPSVPQVSSVTITAQTAKESSEVVNYDKWQYAVSVYNKDDNEGMAVKSNVITSDIDLTNQNIKVEFTAPNGMATGDYFYVYRIFRGEFYFVQKIPYDSATSSYSFTDLSFELDTTKSIKERFSSFDNNNYPAAVGFWNQRLIFANTPSGPNTIYASNVGVYDDFTTTILNNADEAFELTLNSGTTDVITDIVPLDDMIVLTQSKIWRVVGTSAANMSAYIESYSGASGLRPFAYKKSVLYVDSSQNTVSNFVYSYELNGYTGQSLDILCRDLLEGRTITDITFRDTPFGVLYVTRNDGVLLGMTYLREENIWAWHKHTTKGNFVAICCVDKSIDDDVYVVVERNGVRYVELFKPQIDISEGVNDSWHLDCASRYISNVYKWKNERTSTTQRTFYAFKTSSRTKTTPLYCWKGAKDVSTYSAIAIYGYGYSSTTYDFDNILSNSSYTKTTDFNSLSKRGWPNTYPLERSSSGDFNKTETENPTYPDVYVTDLEAGAVVYTRSGNTMTQVGTVTSYSNNQIVFDTFTYSRNSEADYTESSSTKETTYAYTNGVPSSGDTAYKDKNLNVSIGTISAVTDSSITVSSLVYTLEETGIGTTDTITGLSRFNGMAVSVLADGNEYKDIDVINGQIKLDRLYSNILVGLPYVGKLEPIPVDIKFQNSGSTVGMNRRINKATIRYYRTRGLWYGTSEDKLFQIKPYTQETFGEDIPLETNTLNTEVTDTYKAEASFIVEQKSPLPALVQSITLGISYGEKN